MKDTQLTSDGRVVVRIPMKIKRKAGRKEIIPPEGIDLDDENNNSSTLAAVISESAQDSIVIAIARAYRWKELLESGNVPSITALSRRFKVDGSYVGRILRLSLLAPDIVEAIVEGQEPDDLSLRKLTETFPLDWQKQRQHFGFDRRSKRSLSHQ